MTEAPAAPAVNRAQVLLDTALAQRNAAMNQIVELQADLEVARGRIAELEQVGERLAALEAAIAAQEKMPSIDAMVDRFLSWKLPEEFGPDCGISFTPSSAPQSWPVGTNLLTAIQARAMFEYVLADHSAK